MWCREWIIFSFWKIVHFNMVLTINRIYLALLCNLWPLFLWSSGIHNLLSFFHISAASLCFHFFHLLSLPLLSSHSLLSLLSTSSSSSTTWWPCYCLLPSSSMSFIFLLSHFSLDSHLFLLDSSYPYPPFLTAYSSAASFLCLSALNSSCCSLMPCTFYPSPLFPSLFISVPTLIVSYRISLLESVCLPCTSSLFPILNFSTH